MFGRSLRDLFRDDPFFSGHTDHIRAFDDFFARDPFKDGPLGISEGQERGRRERDEDKMLTPFRPRNFEDVFSGFNHSMKQMEEAFRTGVNSDDGHSYTYSAVKSYSKGEDGQPRNFEATSSTREAPGGLKETRKTIRDSERELDKMAIGHHIKDRGHVIERSRNTRTGHQDEKHDYINMDEKDASSFDREWKDKTTSWGRRALDDSSGRRRENARALDAPRGKGKHHD